MNLQNALIHLTYPFSHALHADSWNQQLQRLSKSWSHWWKRLDDAAVARVIDDSYFFLPHVREKLFPETALLEKGSASDARRSKKAVLESPLAEVASAFGTEDVLRLTLDASLLQALHPLLLQFQRDGAPPDDNFQGALGIEWVDLALFPQGVGFLILNVLPDSSDLNVDRLNDYLYHLRSIHAPAIGWQLAHWHCRGDERHGLNFQSVELVDYLLQGLNGDENPIETDFENYLKRIRGNPDFARHTQNPEGQIYGESFREYTYACVDSSEPWPDDANPEQKPESGAALFSSATDRALYELATCTRTQDPEYTPHPQAVADHFAQGHIALWQNWQGLALHDNIVLLGTRASHFTLNALPHNVAHDYFHLYLFTLYQKYRLNFFVSELMRGETELYRKIDYARSLWERFLSFRNRYFVAEVTLKAQGRILYEKFQSGLGVAALFRSASQEVNELLRFYERQAEVEMQNNAAELNRNTALLNKRMAKDIKIVATVQSRVEWLEVLIGSIYMAEMVHMIIESAHLKDQPDAPYWILAGAVAGGLIAACILRPWKH